MGQGLSIGAGLAAGMKLDKKQNRVFVLMGDGECQEGQVWEAAHLRCVFKKLGNLIAVVDSNWSADRRSRLKTYVLQVVP